MVEVKESNTRALLAAEMARQGYPQVTYIRPELEGAMRKFGLWDSKRFAPVAPMPDFDASGIWMTI